MRYEPAIIKQQIDQLLLLFPELTEDEVLRADMIEGSTDLMDFLRLLERKRQEAVAMAEAVQWNMENLRTRKTRFERRDEAMRKLMFDMMQAADLKRVELAEATLSIRNGVPRVIITDELAIPDELCRIKREPDKTKIKQALSDGPVTGATFSNAEATLSIRTK